MSAARQSAIVTRTYKHAPDDCARALELLLKKPVKEGGPPQTAPHDAKKESKHVGARRIIPESS